MIDHNQLKDLIITPVLNKIPMCPYSKVAVDLLLFTCAAETNGGEYLKQINGPALGIYQCEPATHEDIWRNYLQFRPAHVQQLALQFGIPRIPPEDRLIWDLQYATLIARLHYLRVKEPLPVDSNPEGLWEYYKNHYNTHKGSSSKERCLTLYHRLIGSTHFPEELLEVSQGELGEDKGGSPEAPEKAQESPEQSGKAKEKAKPKRRTYKSK